MLSRAFTKARGVRFSCEGPVRPQDFPGGSVSDVALQEVASGPAVV